MSTELPPATAPFSVKLRAAMNRSARYKTQRSLAKALRTDGSLVGKWLKDTIPSAHRRTELAQLLETPADYFDGLARTGRLQQLENVVAEAIEEQTKLHRQVARLQARVRRLEAQSTPRRDAATSAE